MAKTESSFKNMVLVLLGITLIASFSLGAVYNLTKEPIAKAQQAKKEAAIKQVVPDFEQLEAVSVVPDGGGDPLVINKALKGGEVGGYAWETYTEKGF